MGFRVITVLLLCLLATQARAGLMHDSALSWQTAESSHFRIHFHDDEKVLAEHALAVAEDVYKRLTLVFHWIPVAKTEIVLSDEMDMSNGFATPLPSNRMNLYVSPPRSVNSLEDHAGWFETLILHEFVHILHIDKAKSGPDSARDTFGRFALLFPNMFMPPWMHEGLATYYETDKNIGIGRGQSSYFQMMMRMEVANGVKPVRQINQPIVTWPLLTSRYLYGVYYYQFLAETYGVSTLQTLVESYSDHLLPYAINDLHEAVLGKDLETVWAEFDTYLHQKFDGQLQQLQASATPGIAMTSNGDFKRSLVSDGQAVYFVDEHLATGTKLKKVLQDKLIEIADVHSSASLSLHPQAGMLIAQPEVCRNADVYYDLYRLDVQSGEQQRLTHCARYVSATFAADGQSIYALKNERGHHAIDMLDLQGKRLATLWQGEQGVVLSGLDASFDGKALVAAVWREDGGWNIESFDIKTKQWLALTHDAAIKTDVSYLPQSRDVLYAMDGEGVYNIYRLNDGESEAMQLTSVVGGAFSPRLDDAGNLWYVSYGTSGFDVVKTSASDVLQQPASSGPAWVSLPKLELINIEKVTPYEPWDSVLPTSWFPAFYLTGTYVELGAVVNGADVLYRHQYNLYAGLESQTPSPVFNLQYVYDRFDPLVRVNAQRLMQPYLDNQSIVATTIVQRMDVEAIYPLLNMDEGHTFHMGLSHWQENLAWLHASYTSSGIDVQDTLLGAAWVYDTTDQRGRSISPSEGQQWMLLAESGKGLGGQFAGNVISLAAKSYWDLGSEQVLAFQAYAGFGDAKSRPFHVGGSRWGNVISPIMVGAPYNHRRFSLRGYGDTQAALSGQDMALSSLEYRFPIARIERGIMAPPIGVHQLFGQVFVDAARIGGSLNTSPTYTSVGAELGVDLILFYNLGARLQVGVAKGLDATIGENQAYLRLGSMF